MLQTLITGTAEPIAI